MIQFEALIKKFAQQGEKTGWTYIDIPASIANQLKPNFKKSFRVKGLLDAVAISAVAIIPMGEGNFILVLNNDLRKALKKRKNETIAVKIEEDTKGYILNEDFISCLNDDAEALTFFNSLTKGHQNYFSKWIDGAKTSETQTKRIAQTINALHHKMDYSSMLRRQIAENKLLKGR
jgi:Domain of unknown function (DUF1905)/Bacteriocin-protection, YdeI or OmpD-Associated